MKCLNKPRNALSVIGRCLTALGIVAASSFATIALQKKKKKTNDQLVEKSELPKEEKELTMKDYLKMKQKEEALEEIINETINTILKKADKTNINRTDFMELYITVLVQLFDQADFEDWDVDITPEERELWN